MVSRRALGRNEVVLDGIAADDELVAEAGNFYPLAAWSMPEGCFAIRFKEDYAPWAHEPAIWPLLFAGPKRVGRLLVRFMLD
jgi:hypothetical protein